MPMSGYPGLLAGFGPPFLNVSPQVTTGKIFFVSSVTGLANNVGDDPLRPLATLAQALAKCRANKGDYVILMPKHAETITSAGGTTVSTAGVTVIGQGVGANRPTITFSTSAGASLLISANDFKMYNVIGVSGINLLTGPIDIEASGCYIDMEWQDPSTSLQAVRSVAIAATAVVSNVYLKLRSIGPTTGGTSPVNAVRIGGTATNLTTGIIDLDYYGQASTAIVQFVTLASVDVQIRGTVKNGSLTDGTKIVVDTITGTTWMVNVFDMGSGQQFSGGSGATPGLGSASLVVPAANATTNLLERDVIGNKTDTLIDVVTTNVSLMAYVKGALANLSGAAGVATYPTAAAYTNGVSLAAVLGYVQDAVRNGSGTAMPTNTSVADFVGKGTGTKLGANTSLYDVLATAAGTFTQPTAAAPAANVGVLPILIENYNLMERAISTGSAAISLATVTIFTIAGGPIEVVELFAEFQGVAQAVATTLQFNATPTLGAAATLSAASASLSGTAAGSIVLCTGVFANAATIATVNAAAAGTTKFIVGAGTLSYIAGTSANTQLVKWYLRYKPCARGVTVTAAF
jgi:hypothetical protein